MCQLNVYGIPKAIDENQVRECFDRGEIVNNITKNFNILELRDYNFYSYTCNCNCGSIISGLFESKNLTQCKQYSEFVIDNNKKQLNHLYKIRDLQQQSDYKRLFKKFAKERDRLYNIYKEATEKLDNTDYEIPELLAYWKFLEDNKLLDDSGIYPLKPDKSLPFVTVDEEIKELETKLARGYEVSEEFIELQRNLQNLLDISPEVKIFTYWMSGDTPKSLKTGRTIKLNQLSEDILVKLPFEEVLTITN